MPTLLWPAVQRTSRTPDGHNSQRVFSMKHDWFVATAALVWIWGSPVHAETDSQTFLRTYDTVLGTGKKMLSDTLMWNENGFAWANASLQDRKAQPLYCSPENLTLTGDRLVDILRVQVTAHPLFGQMPFGMVLLLGLEQAFPCHPGAEIRR